MSSLWKTKAGDERSGGGGAQVAKKRRDEQYTLVGSSFVLVRRGEQVQRLTANSRSFIPEKDARKVSVYSPGLCGDEQSSAHGQVI